MRENKERAVHAKRWGFCHTARGSWFVCVWAHINFSFNVEAVHCTTTKQADGCMYCISVLVMSLHSAPLQRTPITIKVYVKFCGAKGDCLRLRNDWNRAGPCSARFQEMCFDYYFAENGLGCVNQGTVFSSGALRPGSCEVRVCWCLVWSGGGLSGLDTSKDGGRICGQAGSAVQCSRAQPHGDACSAAQWRVSTEESCTPPANAVIAELL